MIISEVKWGLGNQLFQYAAGLSLAKHHNVPLILDITSYDEDLHREFCLKYFEINDLLTDIESDDEDLTFNYYSEPSFFYDQNFFENSDFTYITGRWQSEKYFIHIKDDLLRKLQVKPQYIQNINISELKIDQFNSVSIHIRRTDYVDHDVLGIQPLEYYYKAIDYFTKQLDNIKFYIFSDEIEWVAQNLKLDTDHVLVSNNFSSTNIEDFYLMQCCKHHIIANSTFSWWAAWLCQNPDKIIIAPSRWGIKFNISTEDMVPKTWLRM